MFPFDIEDELCIGLHTQDLLAIADNARVAGLAVDLLGAEQYDFLRREAEEYLLELLPFVIHHAPYESRLENATGHLCKPAVAALARQRARAAHFRH
jgi:hypothetical protein